MFPTFYTLRTTVFTRSTIPDFHPRLAILLPKRRPYTTPPTSHPRERPTPAASSSTQKPKPVHSPPITQPKTRHEAHEATESLNFPFNPPGGGPNPPSGGMSFTFTRSPFFDAMLTTFIGLGAVFVGGIVYVKWYKQNVLKKIQAAFEPGYDPALELAKSHTYKRAPLDDSHDDFLLSEDQEWFLDLRRKEQDMIDHIIHGEESGHYFMLLGPKGTGKGTMTFDAMAACNADGVSVCEAHPDLEVFRLRLGKALNYEFNEDTQTGLFQRRDPREGGAALDIERAMNKLEKVALQCAPIRGKPFVLIVNNVHYFQNNEEGRNMIMQLQQKAEAWAASGILTMVFSSDDFWPFNVMRKSASRMHVVSIYDLSQQASLHAVTRLRKQVGRKPVGSDELNESVSLVGGRLSLLNKIAKSKEMLGMAKHLLEVEKGWLLSQIGLIPDCDDDVMDEQKWSSCSWLLLQEFVKKAALTETAEVDDGNSEGEIPLPAIPYWKCRQIMTRADFLEELDRLNIISIDIQHNVRPDSNLVLHVAREVVDEDGFEELLQNVRDRIDEIESLHRTRELTFKDLDKGDIVRLAVDKRGAELLGTLDRGDDDG